jgi:hypothetical protein
MMELVKSGEAALDEIAPATLSLFFEAAKPRWMKSRQRPCPYFLKRRSRVG